MNDQISVRQTACFCAISLLALKLIALPSILLEANKSSGLIVAFVLLVIDILVLYLFLKIKQKYPNCSLYDIIEKFLGKIIAKVVYVLVFLFFLAKISILMNETISYMRDIVDEEFQVYVFLLTFLPVITAMVNSGLKSTARTCEFGFVFILIGLIICLFLSEITFNFGELGPIFQDKPTNILKSIFDHSFWFSDFLFVTILADKIKFKKNNKKTIIYLVISISIILYILFIIYFRLFRVTAYLHKTAIADITQYNRNIGNVGNIDIVAILVYLFIIFFQGALYLTNLKVVYEKIVGYENKVHSLVVLNLILVAIQFFVLYSLQKVIDFSVGYLKYFSVLVWVIIPFFYICLLIFDKEKKHDKLYKKQYKKN